MANCNCIPVNLCINPDDLPVGSIPNLQFGVETRWPALYQGKQVYAQLFNYGALPDATHTAKAHNIPDVEWIQVNYGFSYVTKPNLSNYPVLYPDETTVGESWGVAINPSTVVFYTKAKRTDWSAVLCLIYTKTTDEPIVS